MTIQPFDDHYFMKRALFEAEYAFQEGEIPVGAVVVHDNQIIGKGHNQVEKLQDITAHAEIIAISAAASYMGSKILEKCKLYVTLEPCPMCASALEMCRISEIIYATRDPKKGFRLYSPNLLHPKTKIREGIMKVEAENLLKVFFQKKRYLKKQLN